MMLLQVLARLREGTSSLWRNAERVRVSAKGTALSFIRWASEKSSACPLSYAPGLTPKGARCKNVGLPTKNWLLSECRWIRKVRF
jgi:hypothetical protein